MVDPERINMQDSSSALFAYRTYNNGADQQGGGWGCGENDEHGNGGISASFAIGIGHCPPEVHYV